MSHAATLATIIAAALVAPLPAFAQDDPVVVFRHDMLAAAEAPRAKGFAWNENFSHDLRESLGTMFAGRLGTGKVVKGAPYSARLVTETRQALADGNEIVRSKSGAVYRDGEGRTRQETATTEGKESTVYIFDPVAGTSVVLSPASRRAVTTNVAPRAMTYRMDHKDKRVLRFGPSEVRVEDGKVFVDGKLVTPGGRFEVTKGSKHIVVDNGKVTIDGKELGEYIAGHGRHVTVERVEGGDGTLREEIRVQVVRPRGEKDDGLVPPVAPTPPTPPTAPTAAIAPPAPLPPLPGIQTLRFESTARLGKGVTTNLGMKDFDGVKAEGKSTTWTIPAGEIGNRNPIQILSEVWHSPELQVTVFSRHSDPRTGESIYRLEGIRRGEPAAEIFRVPEDYKSRTRGAAPKG